MARRPERRPRHRITDGEQAILTLADHGVPIDEIAKRTGYTIGTARRLLVSAVTKRGYETKVIAGAERREHPQLEPRRAEPPAIPQ